MNSLSLFSESVSTYSGGLITPGNWWYAWNSDPITILGLLLGGWFYARGVWLLWQQAGSGRGVTRRQAGLFAAGWLTLLIALVSPLDALSGVLFSAHMSQHMLLIMVAAPLMVLGAPQVALAWALPRQHRPQLGRWWHRRTWLRHGWRFTRRPLLVWGLHTAAIWVWHMPPLYEAALRSHFVHLVEHLCFLGTALLFWWVLAQCGRHNQLSHGAATLYLFTMALQSGFLGWVLAFAAYTWYPTYAATSAVWGLSPLEDQQLAGVIMWMPAGMIYVIAALTILGRWLHGLEARDRRQAWTAEEVV